MVSFLRGYTVTAKREYRRGHNTTTQGIAGCIQPTGFKFDICALEVVSATLLKKLELFLLWCKPTSHGWRQVWLIQKISGLQSCSTGPQQKIWIKKKILYSFRESNYLNVPHCAGTRNLKKSCVQWCTILFLLLKTSGTEMVNHFQSFQSPTNRYWWGPASYSIEQSSFIVHTCM